MSNNKEPSDETKSRWHQDPNNWFLVLFYFNKEDKRIFPPKRIAWMGWTINFANPFSVGVLLFFLFLVFIMVSLK
ncbi:hypothetical protein SAMN05444372_102284 [Flavobacterium micromati]|jgi:uncharacterized membrane protein|uniref:DUF5808 domain-containing protein n=1 Tax=Flavobacterium micromati TaxID=229205 RepID=A0A1M5H4D0_9FLAO|nr:DUF5808 domain-containing protein [Flavobacterium micromati]SHG10746.1 hypothetical protein SAMN05444372_102284 [Flavobacterium micromati]